MASLKYWLWLTLLPKLGNRHKLQLLEHFASPENIYYAAPAELEAVYPQLPKETAGVLEQKSLEEAEEILAQCREKKIGIVTIDDGIYPDRLRNIFDPPILLYCRGHLPVLDEEAVIALVGTRRATPYGLDTAERLGFGLARHGAVVCTGLARGIDTAAALGALRAGGQVVGVLGCGIDRIYPAENQYLYEDVAARGALLSEYPPGTEPIAKHFPVRNRIISGLSLAAVVVEAPEKSGALITAATALEQGRDVFAVPGNADAVNSQGCLQLLREGAGLAASSWDVLSGYVSLYPGKLKNLSYEPPKNSGYQQREEEAQRSRETTEKTAAETRLPLDLHKNEQGFTDDQIVILQTLSQEEALQADDIIQRTQIPARRALSALTMLEIENYVQQLPGKRFLRLTAIL